MFSHRSVKQCFLRPLSLLLLALSLVLGAAYGQSVSPPTDQTKPTVPPPVAQADTEPQKPITKAQAKALFRSVDEILKFVSQDTGLPIKHKVKSKLITRHQVEHYVEESIKTTRMRNASSARSWCCRSSV